jgi:2'-5' RNA ligase/GNAT superfamily N-acetyltransferase
MPRQRLGVALLVPGPAAIEIDGLRRALGDGSLGRIPAHLTLVPPVNVPVGRVSDALAVLREAAAEAGRAGGALRLRLGPAATFHPVTPVVYVGVAGDVHRLQLLRDRVFRPPLERALTHAFVPHVTLADDMAPERIPAAVAALADACLDVTVDRVHLLREEAGRIWRPVADAPLVLATVVGRGGLPLELTVSERPDPEAARLLSWAAALGPPAAVPGSSEAPQAGAEAPGPLPGPAGPPPAVDRGDAEAPRARREAHRPPGGPAGPLAGSEALGRPGGPAGHSPPVGPGGVEAPEAGADALGPPGGAVGPVAVAARRDGELVGAAHGWTVGPLTRLAALVVAQGARRQGVGARLLAAVEAEARGRGSAVLEAVVPDDPAPTALLSGAGWRPAGSPHPGWRWWTRALAG